MFDIVLYQPEIPPNTGNIMRIAANTGCHLHLVRPMGFQLNNRELKRAGMDYRDLARVTEHACWDDCAAALASQRMFALSTRATGLYTEPQFRIGDAFVFGPETRGLPAEVLGQFPPGLAVAIAHECRQPQPQSIQLRRGDDLRSVAANRIRLNAVAAIAFENRRN